MATRTVTISLLEQTPQERVLRFSPDLSSVAGEILIERRYKAVTDENGEGAIDLPVKDTGSIRYEYEIPRNQGKSTGEFFLSAGATISLDDLIALGGEATDSIIDYIDEALDGLGVPNGGTTGQVLAKASDTDQDTEWVDQSGSGGTETATTLGALINSAGAATPNDSDLVATAVSAGILKKISWTSVKAFLKIYFDTLYQPLSAVLTATTASFTTAKDTKLSGIASGATANDTDANLRDRATHTGTQSADTLTDGTTNKAFLATERTKLAGIATGASANSADATLLARANHTGTQSADTITDGSTNKVLSAANKTKLDNISITQPVDLDDIETRVNNLDAAVVLKGSWDASAGTFPGSGTAQAGASYIVSVAGTVDGTSFAVGDRIIAILDNASTSTFALNWFKADYTDQVLSVNGLTGAVTIGPAQISGFDAAALAAAPAETASTLGATLNAASAANPNDTDIVATAATSVLRKITWTNVKAFLKTYFDTLYQPTDADLTTIAGLTATTDSFLQAKSSSWAARTIAQVKTDLGLTGTNSGDQTSIVGISSTTTQFNTALSDNDFATLAGTETLSNKRVTKRSGTTASSATPTINTDNVSFYSITALAAAITSFTTNLTGTPNIGDTLWIAITDNGTARAITWGASFEASTVALPTTTVISTRLDVGFVWNSVTSKWRCIAVA